MSEIVKPIRRRNRPSLVCTNCRARKLKCDRSLPCSACIKSHVGHLCKYDQSAGTKAKKQKPNGEDVKTTQTADTTLSQLNNKSTVKALTPNMPTPQTVSSQIMIPEFSPHDSITSESSTATSAFIFTHTANSTHTTNNSVNINSVWNGDVSILTHKFELVGNYFCFRKPSHTQARPFFMDAYLKTPHVFNLKFMAAFRHIFNRERVQWKAKNFNKTFDLIDVKYQDYKKVDDNVPLNTAIENLVCKNYYAVLERLDYFQGQLNKILFDCYIPMGVVQLIFHHYFKIRQSGVEFEKPVKNYEYSFISVVTSLVDLSIIFSKFENRKFNFELNYQNNEFSELSVWLLNSSNYKRKASVFSVYTLLNLRLSLMVYGNAQSPGITNQNAHPLLQSAVNLCNWMGLNKNVDKLNFFDKPYESNSHENNLNFSKEIPNSSLKKLWNYILVCDATAFVSFYGTPLIDERFCRPMYEELAKSNRYMVQYVDLINECRRLTLMEKPVSFNDLIDVLKKTNQLLLSFPSFSDFAKLVENEDNWLLLKTKFDILTLYYKLNLHFFSLTSDELLKEKFPAEVVNDPNTAAVIAKLRKEIPLIIKISIFLGLNTILDLSENCTNYKFFVYTRDFFSSWIGIEIIFLVDLVLSNNKANEDNKVAIDESIFLEPKRLKTGDLEKALSDVNSYQYQETINYVEYTANPIHLAAYYSNIYRKVIQIPSFFPDYRFFVITKISLITIYFLYSYINVYNEPNFSVKDKIEELKSLTHKIISKNLQNGIFSHMIDYNKLLSDFADERRKNREKNDIITNNKPINFPSIPQNLESEDKPGIASSGISSNAPLGQCPDLTMIQENQWDEIATSVFDYDDLQSIFDDINTRFNLFSS